MMKNFKNCSITLLAAMTMAACSNHDVEYLGEVPGGNPSTQEDRVANTFDFKTTNDVSVSVDFSAQAQGAVYFEIYDENPYAESVSDDAAPQLRADVKPCYAGYTDSHGRFSSSLTLPASVTRLYVTTGNMLIGARMLEATVVGGRATAALDATRSARAASTGYAQADGEKGKTVPENLWKANGEQVTAEWITPLGRFDLHTGRPNYILQNTPERNWLDEAAAKGLVFSEQEMQGLFEAVGNAVSVDRVCPEYLRVNYDLELQRASELTITLVGSFTGWNNSLGYYIYEGDAPTSLNDVQVIMLFPNTQDGCWYKTDNKGNIIVKRDDVDYHGAIALNRGDAVQLKYFPGYKTGDYTNPVDEFPAGTKIGFVLKNNGWGCQGTDYAVRANGNVTHNWWASSTEGLSYCIDPGDKTKLGGKPRTCKFKYDDFVVLGFEDYGDDENFSDLAFAIRPAEAFQPLPVLESKTVKQQMGVYAFEDLWPSKGDYDMNDVLVDCQYEKVIEKFDNETDDAYKTKAETFSFTTYQNYAALHSGLAVKLLPTKTPLRVTVKKGKNGNFTVVDDAAEGDNVYVLTNDINSEIGTEYRVEVEYTDGFKEQSQVQPFIFRPTDNGRLEVHVPFEAPTSKVDMSLFGTEDDLSDPSKNLWYVRAGNYPYAFYLAGGEIEKFKDTLLNGNYERKPIDTIYPRFINWAVSKGAEDADWYK